jgi:ammonia channel protein AmtB
MSSFFLAVHTQAYSTENSASQVQTATARMLLRFDGGDTAWMLVCTVLVLLMAIPGIMLFYSGMMRSNNALSLVAHVFAATEVVTLKWAAAGYSLRSHRDRPTQRLWLATHGAAHNLLITVLGAGLLWAGWFGFNAGSAFSAVSRAVGALLATQVAACVGAFLWGLCEFTQHGRFGVLGMATGAIAGVIAVTKFKSLTGIDDSLDVISLHWVGGFVGSVLTPVFAIKAIAPITATVTTNIIGALAVSAYSVVATYTV